MQQRLFGRPLFSCDAAERSERTESIFNWEMTDSLINRGSNSNSFLFASIRALPLSALLWVSISALRTASGRESESKEECADCSRFLRQTVSSKGASIWVILFWLVGRGILCLQCEMKVHSPMIRWRWQICQLAYWCQERQHSRLVLFLYKTIVNNDAVTVESDVLTLTKYFWMIMFSFFPSLLWINAISLGICQDLLSCLLFPRRTTDVFEYLLSISNWRECSYSTSNSS